MSISLLFIVDEGGGVGGVDRSIICCGAVIELVDEIGGGEDEGDGGKGSARVRRAWLTRRDEQEYGWSSSTEDDDNDDDGGYFPPVCSGRELFTR